MQKILRSLLASLGLCLLLPGLPVKAASTTPAKITITEVKLGGGDDITFADGTKAKDFITLYNQSSQTILLDGWSLQYAKGGASLADCNAQFAAGSVTLLSGTLLPGTVSSPIKRSMNDTTDGALRLIDDSNLVNDQIGWGTTTKCYDGAPASTPANGKSLERYLDCDTNTPVDTDNNLTDFSLSDIPHPGVLAGPLTTDCTDNSPVNDQGNTESQSPIPQKSCDGVIISELLPNPAGSDTGHEFIELFNPTSGNISLKGCNLQTSANTKTFEFDDIQLKPGQYKAFYNDETGLTLANASGGTVYLVDSDDINEVDQADYAGDLDDDVSWSLIDGGWTSSFSVTPDGANELIESKPCPAGQIRNSDTNRCINIVTAAAGLTPCAPGKKRNPATNRCRSVVSLASALKACASDQVRNPATNRCRKISTSSLTPCQPGQERNPATNRCKKASVSPGSVTDVKDVLSASSSSNRPNVVFAAVSVLVAFSYAIWEWRIEIAQGFMGLKTKFS